MYSRREVMTGGAVGAFATVVAGGATTEVHAVALRGDAPLPASDGCDTSGVQAAIHSLESQLRTLGEPISTRFTSHSLSYGHVARLRQAFASYVRTAFKFPDVCDVGVAVFFELYDWHVRYQQPLDIIRTPQRTTLRFMFTQLVLRPEQDPSFIGDPYDPAR